MPERIYHTVMRTMFKAANGDNKRNTVDRIGSEIVRLHLQVAHGQTGITHKLDKLAHPAPQNARKPLPQRKSHT